MINIFTFSYMKVEAENIIHPVSYLLINRMIGIILETKEFIYKCCKSKPSGIIVQYREILMQMIVLSLTKRKPVEFSPESKGNPNLRAF